MNRKIIINYFTLNPWNRVHLGKLTTSQEIPSLVLNEEDYYCSRNSSLCTLSWARRIPSIYIHPLSL